jgi:hypothetical protein
MYAKQEETSRCGEGSVGVVSSNTTVKTNPFDDRYAGC